MTTQPTAAPRFRSAIAERITTRQETLAAAARHLLDSPGKGLRPLCCRLVGAAFDPQGRTDERHEALAEAIELLHVGSLIHDDILDEAELRRGATAVHVRWNAKVAVLAGDYLLARSTQLVAGLHDNELTVRLAQVVADLCEGELLQDEQLFDHARDARAAARERVARGHAGHERGGQRGSGHFEREEDARVILRPDLVEPAQREAARHAAKVVDREPRDDRHHDGHDQERAGRERDEPLGAREPRARRRQREAAPRGGRLAGHVGCRGRDE